VGLFNDLRSRGVYTGYERYVMKLEPVLQAMAARGLPVTQSNYDRVKEQLVARRAEIEDAMQALIPAECRPFHPKLGFKKGPKDAVEGEVTSHGGEAAVWGKRDFTILACVETGEIKVERWVKLLRWTPSPKNLIAYMRYCRHPIPANYKTGKATTGQLELGRLAKKTKDLLYNVILEYREVSTVIDNHVKNWAPARDGRVHPTFYYETGTGQLASRRPNVQNAPKHKKATADIFRSMVEAPDGYTILSFDYKSFHAQTLAFEAQDPDYLRLAKLDIHSFLTAYLVREADRDRLLQLPDTELQARLAAIRGRHSEIRDQQAKRAILGYGFGMGWRKLYMLNQESFGSQAEAKRVLDTLNGLFPRACKWRDDVRMKAHEQGYLMSRAGCIRWFWEVFKYQEGKLVPGGDDSEAAVAFLPANDAFCHIKDAMLRLEERGLLDECGLINQIHDDLMFLCPDEKVEEALSVIKAEMEKPSEMLIDPVVAPNGLSVEVGIKKGKRWDLLKGV
jgi:DNA polymerase I-like protein with 3'-5' exonuclease and polymerase domains